MRNAMENLNEYYQEGTMLLELEYNGAIVTISLIMSALLLINRYWPNDFKMWAIMFSVVLIYYAIGGILAAWSNIEILIDGTAKLTILAMFELFGILYNRKQALEITFALIILIAIYFFLDVGEAIVDSDEISNTLRITKELYTKTIYVLPFLISLAISASTNIIIITGIYILCIPLICQFADFSGIFDGAEI